MKKLMLSLPLLLILVASIAGVFAAAKHPTTATGITTAGAPSYHGVF
jgi:hypothetical protein